MGIKNSKCIMRCIHFNKAFQQNYRSCNLGRLRFPTCARHTKNNKKKRKKKLTMEMFRNCSTWMLLGFMWTECECNSTLVFHSLQNEQSSFYCPCPLLSWLGSGGRGGWRAERERRGRTDQLEWKLGWVEGFLMRGLHKSAYIVFISGGTYI